MRHAHLEAIRALAKRELEDVEKQIEQTVDRMVETSSAAALAAFENRLAKLERNKLVAAEKVAENAGSKRSFDEMFELAMRFLANPWKLWAITNLRHAIKTKTSKAAGTA